MCTVFLMVTNSLVLSLTNIQKLGGGGGANLAQKYFSINLEMRDEGKKRRRSTAIPESSQDLPSEKKIKGKWVQRKGLRGFTWQK